jgi:hypothetical protein
LGIVHTEFLAHVGESAVAVVVKEMVMLAFKATRSTHDRDTAKLAEGVTGCFGAGKRGIGKIDLDVPGDEEVQAPIAVIVTEGGAC